jgi:hypothetical protein
VRFFPPKGLAASGVAIIAALASAGAQEHGTAFALLRTPEAIYVAADSKLSWLDTTGADGSTCKIRRIGATWYVMGGIYKFTATGYDAPALANLALRGAGTVADKARDFESRAVPAVKSLLEQIGDKRQQVDSWDEVAAIPLTIFIFGFEGGAAVVSSRELVRSATSGDTPNVTVQRRDYGPNTRETVWLASPSNLSGGFVSEYPSWQSMEPSSMVKAFVEFAIRKRPGTTGAPIDIIRIDKNGHRWLRRKTECMD